MYCHHKLFMIMAICAASFACAVEEAEDGALAREALVEEADEQVSLVATEHAACMAEAPADCSETRDELLAAVEHLHELQADELVFRSAIEVTCGNQTLKCSGTSCWGQDEIGCVCASATSGEISLCVTTNDQ